MNNNKIEHLLFMLNNLKEIPQKDNYFKKLHKEQIDNIIYHINLFCRCDLNGVE